MMRGLICSLGVLLCVLLGCGGDDHDTSTEGGTWSVTVANNLGPQTGPNQPAALQAPVRGYRSANPKERGVTNAHGCRPNKGGLNWTCEVQRGKCTGTAKVHFNGQSDTTAVPVAVSTQCANHLRFVFFDGR
jgi:hypothetical protein